ncbi:hypothetical protein C8J56DRAFT_990659 [Mycena floridula]|nr:hypothetical protein C8J56DRAFT_990659 [Mycena floridula]
MLGLEDQPFFKLPILSRSQSKHINTVYGVDDDTIDEPPPLSTIVDSWSSGSLPAASPIGYRKLPENVADFNLDSGSSIVATNALSIGRDRSSQVWMGSMASSPNSQPWPVVIKLFRWALTPDDFNGRQERAETLIQNNAAIFQSLKSLQGRELPWSYGFFKFQLPLDGIVIGHVMEYVPGRRVDIAIRHLKLSSGLLLQGAPPLIQSLHRGIKNLHRYGVAPGELAARDVIATNDFSQAVFFDLQSADIVNQETQQLISEQTFTVLERFEIPRLYLDNWYRSQEEPACPGFGSDVEVTSAVRRLVTF